MSRSEGTTRAKKAVALQYGPGDTAPVIVASGMGYMAEKIVETAADSGVPIYEDNSLATMLTQLQLGQEIPEDLYKAIVEIYVYFLHFDPETGLSRPEAQSGAAEQAGQTGQKDQPGPPEQTGEENH